MVALEGEKGEKVLQAHSFSLQEQDDGCRSRTMGQDDGVALGERVGAQLFFLSTWNMRLRLTAVGYSK
jgi:hypothetical protein